MTSYRERVYQILTGRDHSAWELRTKLVQKGCPAEEATQLTAEAVNCGLVDDERFACALVRSKISQGWGRQRIKLELRRRGLADDVAAQALEQYSEELSGEGELERAAAIAKRRVHGPADVPKVMRYLVSRGFSLSSASRALAPYRGDDVF